MAGRSEVSQRIKLDGKPYREELGSVRDFTRFCFDQVRKDLHTAGVAFQDFQTSVKKNSAGVTGTLKDIGASFARNLGRGALAGGTLAGIAGINAAMKQAVSTGLDFGDQLAKLGSRADLSQKQVKKLREEFLALGATGAQLESLPEAANALFGATGNMDQAMSVMEPIAKTAALGDGNATDVASFVTERLKGEGRDINRKNVEGLLQSLVLAQRGGEFNTIGDAMGAMRGIGAGDQTRAGLSDKEVASIFAGATRAGTNKENGVAAAQALMHLSQRGFGGDAAIAGILGVKGGSFRRNGKFDVDALGEASASFKKRGMKDGDAISLFQEAGLSEQESSGLLSILKNVEKFQTGVRHVQSDTKTLDQALSESTDSLSKGLKRLNNEIVGGFSDIFTPLEGVAKRAANGQVFKALGEIPEALSGVMEGVAKHPGLAAGGLLATAAGGALLKKFGILDGGLAGGVLKGKGLERTAGVTPVYVVNAGEMGSGGGGLLGGGSSGARDILLGGGGAAGVGATGMTAAGALGITAAVGAAAYAGFKLPQLMGAADDAGNSIGLDKVNGAVMDLFRKMEETVDKFFGQKIAVEVDSKDPGLAARPKAADNSRNARGP